MDMLLDDEMGGPQLTDWRTLAQGVHARYLVADFGTGARFVGDRDSRSWRLISR